MTNRDGPTAMGNQVFKEEGKGQTNDNVEILSYPLSEKKGSSAWYTAIWCHTTSKSWSWGTPRMPPPPPPCMVGTPQCSRTQIHDEHSHGALWKRLSITVTIMGKSMLCVVRDRPERSFLAQDVYWTCELIRFAPRRRGSMWKHET